MSLNQKYTWHDFLREFPEHKEKGTKRMSPEGKKAFEAAYKVHTKKFLADRSGTIDKEIERQAKRRDGYISKLKEANKGKNTSRAKLIQKKAGRADAHLARLANLKDRNKSLQKTFK